MGAGGVVIAAARAHIAPGAKLDSAAYMLLFHTAAVLGGLMGLVLGGALISGDIALRAFTGHRLFSMAAPTGGTILIVA